MSEIKVEGRVLVIGNGLQPLIERHLDSEGLSLTFAASATEALSLADIEFDVVVLRLDPLAEAGSTFLNSVHETWPLAAIVVITESDVTERDLTGLGVAVCLSPSELADQLSTQVRRLLLGLRMRRLSSRMPPSWVRNIERAIQLHLDNWAQLEIQKAQFGGSHVPLEILNAIEIELQEVERLKELVDKRLNGGLLTSAEELFVLSSTLAVVVDELGGLRRDVQSLERRVMGIGRTVDGLSYRLKQLEATI